MALKQIDIQACHKQLLQIATIFDQICAKYHIPYYMLGGTMLGAIRHKGFIPWDDDMDFGIPRPDFNRFVQVAKSELPESYSLCTPLIKHQYIKIQLNNSKVIENTFDHTHSGIAIDIFPLDGVNNDTLLGKLHVKIAFALLRFQEGKNGSLRIRKGTKKACAYFIKKLPINGTWLTHFIDRWIQKKDYETATKVTNFYGHWKEKEIMDKSVFSQSRLYPFEQIQLAGVADCHTYLTNLYNNYMQLPPKESQLTHSSAIYIDE